MLLFVALIQSAAAIASPGAMATCLLRGDERATRAVLEAVPGSDERTAAMSRLGPAATSCGAAEPVALDRALGAVAEHWYRKSRQKTHYRVLEVKQLTDAATLDEISRRAGTKMRPVDALTTCVTGLQAPEVQQLLDTNAGSADERAAIGALAPSMQRCVDAGAPARFGREDLRAGFARQFYRSYVAGIPQIKRMVDPALRRTLEEQGLIE